MTRIVADFEALIPPKSTAFLAFKNIGEKPPCFFSDISVTYQRSRPCRRLKSFSILYEPRISHHVHTDNRPILLLARPTKVTQAKMLAVALDVNYALLVQLVRQHPVWIINLSTPDGFSLIPRMRIDSFTFCQNTFKSPQEQTASGNTGTGALISNCGIWAEIFELVYLQGKIPTLPKRTRTFQKSLSIPKKYNLIRYQRNGSLTKNFNINRK